MFRALQLFFGLVIMVMTTNGCSSRSETIAVFKELESENEQFRKQLKSLKEENFELNVENCELSIKLYAKLGDFKSARKVLKECKAKFSKEISTSDLNGFINREKEKSSLDSVEYKSYIKFFQEWVPVYDTNLVELGPEYIEKRIDKVRFPISGLPFAKIKDPQFKEILSYSEHTKPSKEIYLISIQDIHYGLTGAVLLYYDSECDYQSDFVIFNKKMGVSDAQVLLTKVPCDFEEYETTRIFPSGAQFNDSTLAVDYNVVKGSLKEDTTQVASSEKKHFLIKRTGEIEPIL